MYIITSSCAIETLCTFKCMPFLNWWYLKSGPNVPCFCNHMVLSDAIDEIEWVLEWMTCLMPNKHVFLGQVTFRGDDTFSFMFSVPNTEFIKDISLKHQSTDRHVAPPWFIILCLSQSIMSLIPNSVYLAEI